jgi:hypothetical protein
MGICRLEFSTQKASLMCNHAASVGSSITAVWCGGAGMDRESVRVVQVATTVCPVSRLCWQQQHGKWPSTNELSIEVFSRRV